MGALSGESPPVVAPNPKAVEQSQVVLPLQIEGKAETYQGEALQWDPAKARTIALVFAGPWYSKRTIHFFMWAAESVKIRLTSPVLPEPILVDLEATSGPAGKTVSFDLPDRKHSLSDEIRIYLTCESNAPVPIFVGLDGNSPPLRTRMQSSVVANLPLAVLAASWSLVFAALFAVGVQTGSKGALFAAPALAVLPGILNLLGIAWAKVFNVSRLALWVTKTLPRPAAVAWSLAGIPAALLMTYVAFALLVYGTYYHRLQTLGLSEEADLKQASALFCRYPERPEIRALLAKKIHVANSASSSVNAQLELTKMLPVSRFFEECLSGLRLAPLLYEENPGERARSLVFYASIWWNSIERLKDFDPAMTAIREILSQPGKSDVLIALTLAKYETRSIKNQNEHGYCKGDRLAASEDCAMRRKQCAVARSKLVRLIDQIAAPGDVRTVTYLEARDVAASSYMSSGCAPEGPDDERKVVAHLWALVNAIPKQEVVLDDLLLQINFRKYLDSQFEKRPAHQTSQEWQAECQQYRPEVCKLLYETFINDQKQTFFTPDREKRAAEWESPSIPAQKGAALEQTIDRLTKKGWKWPL